MFKKIKAYIYVLFKSLTSPKYYFEILKTDFSFSLKYYVILGIVASLVMTIGISNNAFNIVKEDIYKGVSELNSYYPQDFEITFNQGSWEINKEEPFTIPSPKGNQEIENVPSNLIVFYKEGTIEDLDKYDSWVLMNNVNLIVREGEGIKSYPLDNIPDGKLDRDNFNNFMNTIWNIVKALPYIIFIGVFIGLIFYFLIIRMIYLSVVGMFIWILSLSTNLNITYKDSYRIGLHTMSLPVIVQVIFTLFQFNLGYEYWFITINILFSVLILVLMNIENKD